MRRMMRLILLAPALALAALPLFAGELEIGKELEAKLKYQYENEKRDGGTVKEDWRYELPEGVTTKQVTYYSDEIPCYAKIFYPKGFSTDGSWPGVVLGHGYNAISLAIEKYGSRFAERGLVAMVIDYRGYGFSDPFVRLMEADTSTDAKRVTERTVRVELKRTRLIASKQAEDYRNAISYLQGEPGVNPDKIGIWGSSHAGGVVITVAGMDARVKAVVGQVASAGGRDRQGPTKLSDALIEDAIKRARTGQGAEIDVGFSFRGKVDVETRQTGREHRPWHYLERIPETTAVLLLPAGNEELGNPRGRSGPFEAVKVLKGPAKAIEIPHISHFQIYSGAAFEASSNLAAEWFVKYLK